MIQLSQLTRISLKILTCLSLLPVLVALMAGPTKAADTPSGLPVPRFVSLGAGDINVRNGPGTDHPILWQYKKGDGLPVEIIAETKQWRRIRDSEGNEGWIYAPLLNGRRYLLVNGDGTDRPVALRVGPSETAPITVLAEPGVLGRLDQCQAAWCHMTNPAGRGWIPRSLIWGVYPGETVN
jgi:SH3-like domain-containing protein